MAPVTHFMKWLQAWKAGSGVILGAATAALPDVAEELPVIMKYDPVPLAKVAQDELRHLTANITHDKTAVITAPSWNGGEVEASFVLDEDSYTKPLLHGKFAFAAPSFLITSKSTPVVTSGPATSKGIDKRDNGFIEAYKKLTDAWDDVVHWVDERPLHEHDVTRRSPDDDVAEGEVKKRGWDEIKQALRDFADQLESSWEDTGLASHIKRSTASDHESPLRPALMNVVKPESDGQDAGRVSRRVAQEMLVASGATDSADDSDAKPLIVRQEMLVASGATDSADDSDAKRLTRRQEMLVASGATDSPDDSDTKRLTHRREAKRSPKDTSTSASWSAILEDLHKSSKDSVVVTGTFILPNPAFPDTEKKGLFEKYSREDGW